MSPLTACVATLRGLLPGPPLENVDWPLQKSPEHLQLKAVYGMNMTRMQLSVPRKYAALAILKSFREVAPPDLTRWVVLVVARSQTHGGVGELGVKARATHKTHAPQKFECVRKSTRLMP